MWKLNGEIEYTCNDCGHDGQISMEDFSIKCVGKNEKKLGSENMYIVMYKFGCDLCCCPITLNFEVSEYPVEHVNFVINYSTGARTSGRPNIKCVNEVLRVH